MVAFIDEWRPVTHSIPQWLVQTRMRVAKRISTRKVLCNNDGNQRLFAYRCFLQKMWAVRYLCRKIASRARANNNNRCTIAICFAFVAVWCNFKIILFLLYKRKRKRKGKHFFLSMVSLPYLWLMCSMDYKLKRLKALIKGDDAFLVPHLLIPSVYARPYER